MNLETFESNVRNILEENAHLKSELIDARSRLTVIDDLSRMLEARGSGEVPAKAPVVSAGPFKADGTYSPALAKDQRRLALEAFLIDGNRHLSLSNKTIAKKFGMSATRVADVVGDMVRAGKLPARKKGRPVPPTVQ